MQEVAQTERSVLMKNHLKAEGDKGREKENGETSSKAFWRSEGERRVMLLEEFKGRYHMTLMK